MDYPSNKMYVLLGSGGGGYYEIFFFFVECRDGKQFPCGIWIGFSFFFSFWELYSLCFENENESMYLD